MTTWPFSVCLDRKKLLTGSHSTGVTTWTYPAKDTTIDGIVLGPDFGASAGTIVPVTSAIVSGSNTLITAAGNYSAGKACVGKKFSAIVEFPVFYQTDPNNQALLASRLLMRRIQITMQDTGYLLVRRSMPRRSDATKELDLAQGVMLSRTHREFMFNGMVSDIILSLESDNPRPFTVGGMEILCDNPDRNN